MKCSGWWLIALSRMGLANVRHQPLARPLQRIPALGHMKCWDRDQVATVEANGYCIVCQKITHLHCRFRAHEKTYKVEWLGLDGKWYAKVANPTPWWRRAALFFWGGCES